MRSVIAAASTLLVVGCGADDSGGSSENSSLGIDTSLCQIVDEDIRADVDAALADASYDSRTGRDAVILFPGLEHFVVCELVPSAVHVGVRAHDNDRPVESLFYEAEAASYREVTDLGDRAFLGPNSFGGLRLVGEVGDQQFLVDSQLYAGSSGSPISEELLLDLGVAIVEAIDAGEADPEPIDVRGRCPGVNQTAVLGEVGEVVVARGGDTGASTTCQYASEQRRLILGSYPLDANGLALRLGDNPPTPTTVGDGAVYYFGDGEALYFDNSDCGISVASSPLAWEAAEGRSDGDLRSDIATLVTELDGELSCP